jgi:hypothetical protein
LVGVGAGAGAGAGASFAQAAIGKATIAKLRHKITSLLFILFSFLIKNY